MATYIVLILVVGVLAAACASHIKSKSGSHFDNAGIDAFASLIANNDVQLLDVRTQAEYDVAHLTGAMLIDVKDAEFLARAKTQLDVKRPVAVYCRSGRRSAQAAGMLALVGYRVTNLEGGILAWQQAGQPTEP